MLKPQSFLAVLIVAALSGCMSTPQRKDPLAGMGPSKSSEFQRLRVAVVFSQNTRDSMDYIHKALPTFPTQPLLDRFVAVFNRNFKSVVRVDSLNAAGAANADLAAVLDAHVQLGLPKTGKFTFFADLEAILLTKDGRQVDAFKAHSQRNAWKHASVTVPTARVWDESAAKIEKQLQASKKLVAYARTVPTTPSLAAAPAFGSRAAVTEVDVPSYKTPEDPNKFAMVVGIEKYASIPDARFAENDARAVRNHLLAMGYPERNIIHLTGQQASRAGLKKNLETWLPRNVNEDSTVFFYYSGHGTPDVKSGQAYILPWDGDANFLEDTAYPVERLYQKLNALKAKQIVVAMDSCFSGAGGRSVLAQGARPLITKVKTGATGNLLVLAAADADQITGSEETQRHGLFTYYFLKGLAGGAADASGRITVKGIYDYLRPKVQNAARRENRDQDPRFFSSKNGRSDLTLRRK